MAVTFDGTNKLIICTAGTTSLDVQEDIYSAWKDWVQTDDNAKYLQALAVIGGDPITETISLGSTYFLENGWKIRPQESSHVLTVSGNLYARDGSSPFVVTLGNYNVMISMARSNLIDTVNTAGTGPLTAEQETQLADAALNSKLIPALL